jgi:hypothetical protein
MKKAIYKGFRMQVVTCIVFLKIKGGKSFICKNECFKVGVSSITVYAIILISSAILWNVFCAEMAKFKLNNVDNLI